jgi:ATP-dependent helicase/nuclease subunit A
MPPERDGRGSGLGKRVAVDRAERDRVEGSKGGGDEGLGTTYLLEASAGTGKTSVLVNRYVNCVLAAGDVRRVAAITFTEKAAGELRQRIREEFEKRAGGRPADSDEAAAIEAALDALDDAPIGTIHGFAGRLLREFPVEAGVDPAFEQLDALGSEIERGRLWDEWLTELAGGGADEPDDGSVGGHEADARRHDPGQGETGRADVRRWLSRLLCAGVKLDDVHELAAGPRGVFGERYDIDPVALPAEAPDLAAKLPGLTELLDRLRDYCATACSNTGDNGYIAALTLVEACEVLLREPPAARDLDQLAAALFALPVKTNKTAPGGTKASWDATRGGKDELQVRYQTLVAAIAARRERYAVYLTGLAVAVADSFSRWAGAAQLAQGRLDFTDLLGRLRDLLRDDHEARRALQDRFDYLLVDEFQDTDPLQTEIVFFLCERQAPTGEPPAGAWRDVVLEPGKLFVVGDPKQSIYRFRRADITLYDAVEQRIGEQPDGKGQILNISQNFRTTPRLVAWANRVFDRVFAEDEVEGYPKKGRQPPYQNVEAFRPPAGGPRVAVLLGRPYGGEAGEADATRRDEARAVAALLVRMHGADAKRWQVQDREALDRSALGRFAFLDTEALCRLAVLDLPPVEPLRPLRWGDVAVLFRATTGLETYEQALREAGVPYRVEGGKAYFKRREVDDALLCLRAVDDPSDGPAIYGALHSSLFGFSDDDLFVFWAAGGRFDLFAAAQPTGHEAIVAALGVLRDLHARRSGSEPHELLAELSRLTHAPELLAATGSGAAQAIANLEKLTERARAFVEAGGGGLGAFLAWAVEAGDAAGEQESQVDDDADAVVHLLTIHKAKGLEFPVVVLVGGARSSGGRGSSEPIVDRDNRCVAVKLKAELPGAAARDLEPRRYLELKEREKVMGASEMRRLLYVAATRARDRLIVTNFGKLTSPAGEVVAGEAVGGALLGPIAGGPAGALLAPIAGALPAAEVITEEHDAGGVLVLPPTESPVPEGRDEAELDAETTVAERRAWLASRSALLARAARPAPATSPSGLEHLDEQVRSGGPGAPPGRARALALGSAVHRIMELCDLGDEGSIARVAGGVALDLGRGDLAGEAAALATACWRAAPVRAAAAAAAAEPGAVFRELPVGALIDDIVVSGAIDLLYRDGQEWVVVDYKTDRGADGAVLRERYTPQGAAYAVAVEAATGGVVREVVFVAARADGLAVAVPVDDSLRRIARREVDAAAGAGRAVCADELTGA